MVYWLVLLFAVKDSPTRCCTLNLRQDTTFLLLRQRMTNQLLELSWMLSSWTKKNSVLATLKFSSELVFLDSWRRLVRTELVRFLHGFNLEPEVRHQECNSRNSKIKSLHFTAARDPSVTTTLVRPGCGGTFGSLSSPTSSVLSLENTSKNMKRKLLLLKQTLTRLLLIVKRSRLFMMALLARKMSWSLPLSLVDLLSKKSLTKPLALKAWQMM